MIYCKLYHRLAVGFLVQLILHFSQTISPFLVELFQLLMLSGLEVLLKVLFFSSLLLWLIFCLDKLLFLSSFLCLFALLFRLNKQRYYCFLV